MSLKNKRAIHYIFNGRFPTEKAHGIQVAKMCEAFINAGIDTTLIVPFRRGIVSADYAGYYGLKNSFKLSRVWGLDPGWLWKISSWTGYYVQSVTSFIGILFYLAKHSMGRNILLYTRDYPTFVMLTVLGFRPAVEIHDYRLKRPSFMLSFAFFRARSIIANSAGTKSAILGHYNIRPDRILVCPNGVDLDFFNVKLTKLEARKFLDLPPEAFIIGYAGRLEAAGQSKGVAVIEDAFKLIKNRISDAHLLIIGGEKFVPYNQIPLYLKSFDVAILPLGTGSLAGTTAPMKLFEYLAAGCAIIAADAPSLKAYLDDSCAIFFDSASPESLAKSILLLTDDQKRYELSKSGKIKARSYAWNVRADNIIEFIQW